MAAGFFLLRHAFIAFRLAVIFLTGALLKPNRKCSVLIAQAFTLYTSPLSFFDNVFLCYAFIAFHMAIVFRSFFLFIAACKPNRKFSVLLFYYFAIIATPGASITMLYARVACS